MPDFSPIKICQMLSGEMNLSTVQEVESQVRAAFTPEQLSHGWAQIEQTTALFAVEIAQPGAPELVTRTYEEDGSVWFEWEAPQPTPRPDLLASEHAVRVPMTRLGESCIYLLARDFPNFSATAYRVELDGQVLPGSGSWVVFEWMPPEPECDPQPDIPHGTVKEITLRDSTVYPGTVRGMWLYIPAQYKPEKPAAWMLFQDGGMYLEPTTTVFDNLIHSGEMPVTVGIFLNPGTFPEKEGRFQNRHVEYDTVSGDYARFIEADVLPEVQKHVTLRADAASHAICGISSGGVCALVAAFERPDLFSKVVTHCGSFTNILGAHDLWTQIRMQERKPLRVFLQGNTNDIDDICGNWYLANRQVEAALKFRSYVYKAYFGRGYHSLAVGSSIFPSTLKWLWRN